MPIRCVLCHLRYRDRGNRSFHRFPIDAHSRKKWLSCIGKESLPIPGKSYLCSDHFSSSDLRYSPSGLRKLSRHAVPVPGLRLFENQSQGPLQKIKLDEDSSNETETASEVGDESGSSGKESVAEMVSHGSSRFPKSTSVTDTPREIRNNAPVIYSETESVETSTNLHHESLRLRNLEKEQVYSGDIQNMDIKSSENEVKFFHFAKNVLEKQKFEIKNLRQKYSILENKLASINNLMNRLIKQDIII